MQWELWAVDTANLIGALDSEAEALDLVRELLAKGWDAANLMLIFDDQRLRVEDLPPAISGAELAQRAGIPPFRQTRSA
jgi:hypothetical protein